MSRWRRARVSASGTHHELDGESLYADRFDEALSFHEPGLAAVRRGAEAWHIDEEGAPAYARRFARTFGFYESLAAVVDASGWAYIGPDGVPRGDGRFAWCGNFQDGRATVRDSSGLYFHIDHDLQPTSAGRWRYAGDYRHGIAVVQGDHGKSTHVDRDGQLLHGRWFDDLDVFHKGYARARDSGGWMHVDLLGAPVYGRRFAVVEPFYNGQARVERSDGGLEIIDERGEMLHELRPAQRDEFAELSRDLVGWWSTDTLASAVACGLTDALPGEAGDLAARCELTTDGAERLLRALGELGIVEEASGRWCVSPRGAFLRSEHPLSLAGAAVEYAGPLRDRWRHLLEALRSETWSPPDVFAEVAGDAHRTERHGRMLASYAAHDYPAVAAALPVRAGERVIDAGGGTGILARAILDLHPELHVSIIERPEVVAMITDTAAGRLRPLAGDLFAPWPTRGDLIVLARVLHDWDDERALVLLRRARHALEPGGRLAIVEMLRDERGFGGALCGLHLLAVSGGRERTLSEYARLLDVAGFAAPTHHPVAALPQLLMTRPA